MTDRQRLLALVGRIRRGALILGLIRIASASFVGLAAGPLLSVTVLPWTPAPWRPWIAAVCVGIGAMAGIVLGVRQWRVSKPIVSWADAGRLLAEARPDLRDLIRTGADLAAWGEGGVNARGASPELVEGEISLAQQATRDIDWVKTLPLRSIAPWVGGCVTAFALLAVGYAANPWNCVDTWRAMLAEKPLAAVAVGNLRVRYEPPAYTGLKTAVVEGSSGAVEGYKGTRVTLEGELSGTPDAGRWEDTNGRQIALEVRGRTFRVSWILDRPGSYSLAFQRGGRPLPAEFQPQSMAIREDERPKVELEAPEEDVEVRSDAEMEVRFSASDDFRVDRAEIVLQGDAEVRIPAKVSPGGTVVGSARFLPMGYPKLGSGANLRVEAWDSDAVTGPKPGASRSIYVAFLDKKKLMADIQGLEERLLEALLSHLADHLEMPTDKSDFAPLRGKATDLLRLFATLAERVKQGAEEGALGALAVLRMEEGLRSALGPFADGVDNRAEVVGELERDILFLDRLLRNLRMEETLSLADELSALQRSLFDQLTADARAPDLLGQIDQIERLLRQMAEKLSRGASDMPDAFANADAVKDAPSSELQEILEKLKKALREGDRETAKKLAEKLLDTLSRWMKALEDAAEGAAGGEMNPVLRDLAKLDSEVSALVAEQEQVLRGTRTVADEASRRVTETRRGELRSFVERQEQRLNQIAEYARRLEAQAPLRPFHGTPAPQGVTPSVPGPLDLFESSRRVSSAVSEVRQALREDLGRARSGADALGEAFESLRQQVMRQMEPTEGRREVANRYAEAGRREIEALRQDLGGLDQLRMRALGPREQQALRELAGDERMLGERTGKLAERLEDLARRTPFLGPGLPERARSSEGFMGGAGEKLRQSDAFGALSPEGKALEGLSEISRELQGARRQMQQARGRGGFQTIPSPRTPGGGREVDRSRVEIPKEVEARELKAFREEVLKAMRRGQYPKNYEEEVEKYYERLIR